MYLVSFTEAGVDGIQAEPYARQPEAYSRAEALLTAGISEVRVWKHYGTPKLTQTITWEGTTDAKPSGS